MFSAVINLSEIKLFPNCLTHVTRTITKLMVKVLYNVCSLKGLFSKDSDAS